MTGVFEPVASPGSSEKGHAEAAGFFTDSGEHVQPERQVDQHCVGPHDQRRFHIQQLRGPGRAVQTQDDGQRFEFLECDLEQTRRQHGRIHARAHQCPNLLNGILRQGIGAADDRVTAGENPTQPEGFTRVHRRVARPAAAACTA